MINTAAALEIRPFSCALLLLPIKHVKFAEIVKDDIIIIRGKRTKNVHKLSQQHGS